MAFGPEINAAYTDGARIALREPSIADLDALFEYKDEDALDYLSDQRSVFWMSPKKY